MQVFGRLKTLAAEQLGGKLFLFGSYRLGVQQSGSNMEAICVAPYHIQRTYFITTFFEFLQRQPEFAKSIANVDSMVTYIRVVSKGIFIDLLFARLNLTEIPDGLDLKDNNLLRNLDIPCFRSLAGVRVAEYILTFVPNYETFRLALGTIRLWAKKRGIYSSAMGYFGGITWAIMVAHICQKYPNAAAASIVNRFFYSFLCWKWPKPVMLGLINENTNLDLPFAVWNWSTDRRALMPIITPAYPQKNSTFRVTKQAKKIIYSEIKCGLKVCNGIMSGRCTWKSIFAESRFFKKYRYFHVLWVSSKRKTSHLEWCELVENNLYHLIVLLESHPEIRTLHANSNRFPFKSNEATIEETHPFRTSWFIGLGLKPHTDIKDYKSSPDIIKFLQILAHLGANSDLSDKCTVDIHTINRKQLGKYLDEDVLNSD